MADDLQTFLELLDRENELKVVSAEVDAELEITEIARRQIAENGPALLFENVNGSRYPLAINLFASERRIELGLGRHPQQIGEELLKLADGLLPPTPRNLWNSKAGLWKMRHFFPRRARKPLVREVETDVFDLGDMPVLKCWPEDGGRFITLPLVVTQDRKGVPNMGVYRMQIYDGATTGMHFQIAKGGGYHLWEAQDRMRVGVALGGDLPLILAAVTALPEGINEQAFAGVLRNKATEIFNIGKLPAPANAEFVLSGWINPREERDEGPFGDHFGHYSERAPFPVFHVERLYSRRAPIYPATVVGKPPMEDRWLGDASQQAVTPLIRVIHKEVRDMWAYYEAGFHNLLVVAVDNRHTREPVKTAFGLLGEGQLSLTKSLILVDANTNPSDFGAVLDAIRQNYQSERDFRLLGGTLGDTLDFTTERPHYGSKMVLDATTDTRSGGKESASGGLGGLDEVGVTTKDYRVLNDCMLVVRTSSAGKDIARGIASNPGLQWLKLAAVVSDDVDIRNDVELLWGIFTRFDCARDIVFNKQWFRDAEPCYSGLLTIDATWKQGYQKPLLMTDEIVKKVDARWGELF